MRFGERFFHRSEGCSKLIQHQSVGKGELNRKANKRGVCDKATIYRLSSSSNVICQAYNNHDDHYYHHHDRQLSMPKSSSFGITTPVGLPHISPKEERQLRSPI
jgi:hypothetical protein